jgi:serine/threonine-protein kinase HipA
MSPVFSPVSLLNVFLNFGAEPIPVGRLALLNREIVFEFSPEFPAGILNISPLKLRTNEGHSVISGPSEPFEGLHGVFSDSLPDGWGRLLVDRKVKELGVMPAQLTSLDRLAWVGANGMGALTYQPERLLVKEGADERIDLDELAAASRQTLEDVPEAVFEHLLMAGGSPQGARPKALIGLSANKSIAVYGTEQLPDDYQHWLVKFVAPKDHPEAGLVEKVYANMSKDAGINVSESVLLPSGASPGYFATKRFDRINGRRLHMHTAAGMLHADFRLPSAGYVELLKLVGFITRDHAFVEQMFLRMVFNIIAHNRDDHIKNHAFLMNDMGHWSLSPAYDVTFSGGPGGEHTLDVAGEGKNPTVRHILKVAASVGLSSSFAKEAFGIVRDVIARWPEYASEIGVSSKEIQRIGKFHNLTLPPA